MRTLDIGSGHDSRADVNFDIVRLPEVDVQGTMDRLPFKENSFSRITLRHVLEHAEDPIDVLTECWRICDPSGQIEITVPHGVTARYVRDPTHSSAFTLRSIEHFVPDSGLPNWYENISFELLEGKIVSTSANQFDSNSFVRRVLTWLFNRTLATLANIDPDVFEPFLSLASHADIVWTIKPRKNNEG